MYYRQGGVTINNNDILILLCKRINNYIFLYSIGHFSYITQINMQMSLLTMQLRLQNVIKSMTS